MVERISSQPPTGSSKRVSSGPTAEGLTGKEHRCRTVGFPPVGPGFPLLAVTVWVRCQARPPSSPSVWDRPSVFVFRGRDGSRGLAGDSHGAPWSGMV